MSLSELVEKAESGLRTHLVEIAGAAQTALYFSGALYGEHLQALAENGLRDYDFLQGHLSDFGAIAAETALNLGAVHYWGRRDGWSDKRLRFMEYVLLCIPATLHSMKEITELMDPNFTFDPVDILAYIGGAVAAYGSYQLSKSVKKRWEGRREQKEES